MKLKTFEKPKGLIKPLVTTPHYALSIKPKTVLKKHQNLKPLKAQEIPTTTRLPSKPRPEIKIIPTSTNFNIQQRKKFLKQNTSSRHSISSKEDFEKHSNKLKTKKAQIINSNKPIKPKKKEEELNIGSIKRLSNLFRKSNLKKTIIIDGDGNNNLNFNFQLLNEGSNETTPKNTCFDKQTTNDNIIKDTQYTSGKVTENFINEANIKDTEPLNQSSSRNINNYKDEENDRLKEYGKIFNLINNNIEQMKNMFSLKTSNTKCKLKNEKEPFKKKAPVIYPDIITPKEREEINKIKPMPTYTEFLNGQTNSFLESCVHDEFYQSFTKAKNNLKSNNAKDNFSIEFTSSVISDPNIINSNLDKTECENDELCGDKLKSLRNNNLNPHFLLNTNKTRKKSNKSPVRMRVSHTNPNISFSCQNKDFDLNPSYKCNIF